jgi:hypothetical protein
MGPGADWRGNKGAATTGANKKKKAADNTGWGAKIWSALGGGGVKDPTNVASHPESKLTYKKDTRSSTDTRSMAGKLWDELKGETVGGNPIRQVESVQTARPGGGPKTPRAAVKKETVATAPRRAASKTTAVAAAPKTTARGFVNERAASAGYTTSGTPRDPGFTYGSKSSAAPKMAPFKKKYEDRLKSVQGAKHTVSGVKGLKWFGGKD